MCAYTSGKGYVHTFEVYIYVQQHHNTATADCVRSAYRCAVVEGKVFVRGVFFVL